MCVGIPNAVEIAPQLGDRKRAAKAAPFCALANRASFVQASRPMQIIRQQVMGLLSSLVSNSFSKRLRLRRELHAVQEEFRKKVTDARRSGNAREVDQLIQNGHWAAREYEDALEAISTEDLLKRARRAKVQIPVRPSVAAYLRDEESDPTWYLSQMTGEWYLTYDGYWKLHKDVRAEERERLHTWTGIIGVMTGFLGAAAALAAILSK